MFDFQSFAMRPAMLLGLCSFVATPADPDENTRIIRISDKVDILAASRPAGEELAEAKNGRSTPSARGVVTASVRG